MATKILSYVKSSSTTFHLKVEYDVDTTGITLKKLSGARTDNQRTYETAANAIVNGTSLSRMTGVGVEFSANDSYTNFWTGSKHFNGSSFTFTFNATNTNILNCKFVLNVTLPDPVDPDPPTPTVTISATLSLKQCLKSQSKLTTVLTPEASSTFGVTNNKVTISGSDWVRVQQGRTNITLSFFEVTVDGSTTKYSSTEKCSVPATANSIKVVYYAYYNPSFNWDSSKTKGQAFNITATEWNKLIDYLGNKGITGITKVKSGDRFTASAYNAIASKLGVKQQNAGSYVTADCINELITKSNSR